MICAGCAQSIYSLITALFVSFSQQKGCSEHQLCLLKEIISTARGFSRKILVFPPCCLSQTPAPFFPSPQYSYVYDPCFMKRSLIKKLAKESKTRFESPKIAFCMEILHLVRLFLTLSSVRDSGPIFHYLYAIVDIRSCHLL